MIASSLASTFSRALSASFGSTPDALNAVDWADLGFVCDKRYLFTQRSLENAPLPDSFRAFLPAITAEPTA